MFTDHVVASERFTTLLEWALALEKRYTNAFHTGLIQIEYNRRDVIDSSFGVADAANRLGEVMDCLEQCFRDTDAIARFGTTFWVLVPMTQADPVAAKVQTIIDTANKGGLNIGRADVRVHMLGEHIDWLNKRGCDPHRFMTYLGTLQASEAHV